MTAPIRKIIDEEIAVLIENIHKDGNYYPCEGMEEAL